MAKETKILYIVEGIILLVVLTIGVGYAYLSTSGKQERDNTFTAGCLNITIEEEGRAIDLKNAYPITDIEGLEQEGYNFKIKNNCSNETNYQINLETISNPKEDTTLNANYVRVSLASDTMDNLITTLSENDVANYHSDNTYVSYNLYEGIIGGNETKEFTLKEWVEYNTTKEQGTNKTYKSQINVVSDTRVEVTPKPEITFAYSGDTIKGTITGSATDITYCETKDNECEPKQSGEIQEQTTSIPLNEEIKTKEVTTKLGVLNAYQDYKRMVCAKLDDGKTICSNPDIGSGTPDFKYTSEQSDNVGGMCTYEGKEVYSWAEDDYVTEETCRTIYEATYLFPGYIGYYDKSLESSYKGKATWNEETSTCTYNGEEVYDFNYSSIVNEEDCGDVYYSEGEETYYTMIEKLSGQGIWNKETSTCTYNGEEVYNWNWEDVTEENCGTIYEVKAPDRKDVVYYDKAIESSYKGKATWNEETSTCEYDGEEVYDRLGTSKIDKENCGDVYYNEYERTYYTLIGKADGKSKWTTIVGKTGIYETKDEEGTSYYYRGAVENNYVEFAGFYWRIIRINGNGSIRLLYNGKKSEIDATNKKAEILENGYDDSDTNYTVIELSDGSKEGKFNEHEDDNTYVGYMYGTARSETYEDTHKNITDSNVKKELDAWYIENLKRVEDKLDIQTGFCNDRSLAEGYENAGYGTKETNYGAFDRIWNKYQPTLKCKNKANDYFTWKERASTGNKELINPIGLITADEVMYAGAYFDSSNHTYYLYNGREYWTMSPYAFSSSFTFAGVFSVIWDGELSGSGLLNTGIGVRPVINVDPNKVSISGSGTIDSPYVFS